MMPVKKILTISGSIRSGSSSHSILAEIVKRLPTSVIVDHFSELAAIPAFDGREDDPESVKIFKSQIREADGVILCTPEYAFGVPGALKNALDWTVGSGDFVDKPVALITASSLGEHGHQSLLHTLTAISARLSPDTTLLISYIRAKVKDGKVVDSATQQLLTELTEHFVHRI